MLFRQDEKTILVQIFFYCLDYVSRLPKNCSKHSGKLKHASARNSASRLSLKITGNQWTLVGNHALCWVELLHFSFWRCWNVPEIFRTSFTFSALTFFPRRCKMNVWSYWMIAPKANFQFNYHCKQKSTVVIKLIIH